MVHNKEILKKAAAVLFALLVWQAAAMLLNRDILLVSPIKVAARLGSIWRESYFFPSVWFSFSRIVLGFLLALAVGGGMAVLAGRFRLVEIFMWPFVVTIKAVPVASFIVISLIWLTSRTLAVFISFLMVFPVVYSNTLQGIKSTDPHMLEMADVFRIPWFSRFTHIYLPTMKPFILSACSVALGISWKAGIAAEIIGIPTGSIGEQFYIAKVHFDTVDLLAWTVIVVFISVCFEKLVIKLMRCGFDRLERR